MIDSDAVLEEVRRRLRREPRIDFDHQAISLTFANGELLLSGEVGDIAAKRLAVERAATAPPVTALFDEVRVRPAESLPDGEIRDLVRQALVSEPALTWLHDPRARRRPASTCAFAADERRADRHRSRARRRHARRRGAEPRPKTARGGPRLVEFRNL